VVHKHVPVSMGSPRFQTMSTTSCMVIQAWFPAHAVLEPHTHERSIFALMLEGSFDTVLGSRRLECTPAVAWTEPREERHANFIGCLGARVLVIQPDPARVALFEPFRALLEEVHRLRHPAIGVDARRVTAELKAADDFTSLAIDSLVLGMLTSAARQADGGRHHDAPPRWLLRVRDLLHARCRDHLQLSAVAEMAGVHPSHLAHAFRRYFGTTMGEYARHVRLTWALDRLATCDDPISVVAIEAGYADQSHLTRACQLGIGEGPAAVRRRHQPRAPNE
jgi:AraC family transcriptional regulator